MPYKTIQVPLRTFGGSYGLPLLVLMSICLRIWALRLLLHFLHFFVHYLQSLILSSNSRSVSRHECEKCSRKNTSDTILNVRILKEDVQSEEFMEQ